MSGAIEEINEALKAKGNRIIERNQNLIRHRQKVKELLESEIGSSQKKRKVERGSSVWEHQTQ